MPTIKEINGKNYNKGLFADQAYDNGGVVLFLSGNYISEPTRTSIQIGGQHLESIEGGHINHHCDPNTRIVMPNFTMPFVSATRNIEIGEELTFDYETTEEKLVNPFKCDCHEKWIKGYKQ